MITRSVEIDEQSIAELEELGLELLSAGDIRATKLLTLALAWGFAAETPAFHCHIDESAGLAELYALDAHSRKVPHAS